MSAACPRPDKRPHDTQEAAEKALRALRGEAGRQGRNESRWLTVYLCPCGSWHVGDQRFTLDRKIRETLDRPGRRGRRT